MKHFYVINNARVKSSGTGEMAQYLNAFQRMEVWCPVGLLTNAFISYLSVPDILLDSRDINVHIQMNKNLIHS